MIALVLSAGLGTRFRPATLTTPKPLLPFLGRPILFHLFDHLISEGVDQLVLNSHHLGDVLEAGVGRSYHGCEIQYSKEKAILGTAGALRRAAESGLLPEETFLVANGDLFTTLPLGPLLRERQRLEVVSALAVVPNDTPGRDTPLWRGPAGDLAGVGGERPDPHCTGPWLFTGLQAARRTILARIPEGVSELARDVLAPSARRRDGAFALVPYRLPEDGFWFDLGTPDRLRRAEVEVGRPGAHRSVHLPGGESHSKT